MPEHNAPQQWRSARHYLTDQTLTERLQPTLALAARTLGFPTAMITILDQRTQHTIAVFGEGHPSSPPDAGAFCDAVVHSGSPLVVQDARLDARFASLPTVELGRVGAFVGLPLRGREMLAVGSFCVIDPHARVVDADQLARLEQFGTVIEDQLDLIRRLREQRGSGGLATAELAKAIAAGEIVPWYQPIVDRATGRVIALEALARWVHPSGEVQEPNTFVPLAEDSELIIELDLSVIRQALVDLKRWQRSHPGVRLSVNMSARHFDHADWLVPILAALQAAGVSSSAVDVELTESTKMSFQLGDHAFVEQLQEHGFRVWLDDFGTGWSSMEYLLRLPVDGLKIDRVLSLAMGSRIGDTVIRSIIDLGHELGMQNTIEGIESLEAAAHAAGLGCDNQQGYLWSAPVPGEQVDSLLVEVAARPPAVPTAGHPDMREVIRRGDDSGTGWLAQPSGWAVVDAFAGAVLDAIPDGTAVLDCDGTIVAVNRAWRMFSVDNGGSDSANGVGVNYLDICRRAAERGTVDAGLVQADIRAVLEGAVIETEREYPCPSPTGRRWYLLRVNRLTGPVPGVIVSHVNITRRKMAEEELTHAANHDALTGLANRTLLHLQLVKALSGRTGTRPNPDVGVLYIDLDGFKSVNDTFGHYAGDDVLQTVAHRLRTTIRPGSVVARVGGDEFAVVVPRISSVGLTALASRISTALAEPHHIHGHSVPVGGSVGVHLSTAGHDASHALRRADEAMYETKRRRQFHSMADGDAPAAALSPRPPGPR